MMKARRTSILWIALVIVLLVALIGFYLYDVLYLKTPATQHLFRTLSVSCVLLATLIRLCKGSSRASLETYEKAYAKELGHAFSGKPMLRKKLLCACRLYNENNYDKALKYLAQLLNEAELPRDAIPVWLFIALCYSDARLPKEAVRAYFELLKLDPKNAQAHSNLGRLFVALGDFEMAFKHYDYAITYDPMNYAAQVNRANLHFKVRDYDPAICDAVRALEIRNNGVEAASLLTIIYTLLGDEEQKSKYYHISISSGKRPDELDNAIQYYLKELSTVQDDEPEED